MVNMDYAYLDYNATAPMQVTVQEAMQSIVGLPYNASSVHYYGRKAKAIIEDARRDIATVVNAGDNTTIFVSCGTEANNLALKAVGRSCFVSSIEHPSVLHAVEDVTYIPVTQEGVVDIQGLEKLLMATTDKILVSVMLANNETGIIQPIKAVTDLARKYGALVHCDATQGLGKINVDMQELGVDLLSISSHKIGGPQGAAALIAKPSVKLSPQLMGGGQEKYLRAGTENIAAIYGFALAAKAINPDGHDLAAKRDAMETQLQDYNPDMVIIGKNQARLPNTSYIAMPGVSSETQLIHFDLERIALSAGAACSSGKIEPSHVLKAMQVPSPITDSVIRVSIGNETTDDEIKRFIQAWKKLYDRFNQSFSNMKATG